MSNQSEDQILKDIEFANRRTREAKFFFWWLPLFAITLNGVILWLTS